jgi:hypothetical protein
VDCQSPPGERHSHPVLQRPSPRRVSRGACYDRGRAASNSRLPHRPGKRSDSPARRLNIDAAAVAAAATELAANAARFAAAEAASGDVGAVCANRDLLSGGAVAAAAQRAVPTGVAADNATPASRYAAAVAVCAITMDTLPSVSDASVSSNKRSSLALPTSPATANGADGRGGGKRA